MNKRSLQQWFEARWYGGVRPGLALRALALLFDALTTARRMLYRIGVLRSARLPVPVMVIGNLSVGGAGKTPLTIALVHALRERGWKPGVVSRGYGRREKMTLRVSPDMTPEWCGDEPLLIARESGAPVAVGSRRADAARLLLERGDVDLVIADDGLQHYALARDMEILVVDGVRRYGNGLLLPAGPLREPTARGARCDFTIVNGGIPSPGEWAMQLHLRDARPLLGGADVPLREWHGESVNALAGIADPARFFNALCGHGIDAEGYPFPDHHQFAPDDFAFDDGRPLLMTEKDADKCRPFARPHWYVVPAAAEISPALPVAIDRRLRLRKDVRPHGA